MMDCGLQSLCVIKLRRLGISGDWEMACGAGGGDLWDEGHAVVEAVGGQEHEIELGVDLTSESRMSRVTLNIGECVEGPWG